MKTTTKKVSNKIKRSMSERIFNVINIIVFAFVGLSTVLPFVHILAVSFSGRNYAAIGAVSFWPRDFQIDAYLRVFNHDLIMNAYGITIFITVAGTLLSLLVTVFMAYPLSKKYLEFRRTITMMVMFTMIFSGGLVPFFILVQQLGLINSVWSLILPTLVSPFFLIILKNFFTSIPQSLEEAAIIDGCHDLGVLFKIVLPLSLPALATIALFYAVPYWNTFFNAILFIQIDRIQPLQPILRNMIAGEGVTLMGQPNINQDIMNAAAIMFTTVPILVVYPFIQKYFVTGVMIGAVKE